MAYDAFVYFPEPATNASDLKIEGESTDDTYSKNKAFEIYSFSWGASNPVTVGSAKGGSGAGKVTVSSFNLMKKTDTASPSMMQACIVGAHFPTMTVALRKAGGKQEVFITYTFSEVYVESVQWSGSSGGDDTPAESVSLAFAKVTGGYTPQKSDGTMGTEMPFSYDITANTKPS